MANPSDSLLRTFLGPSLQVAAMRVVLLLALLAAIGAIVGYFVR